MNVMRPLKEKVSITLDGDLLEKLRSLSEEHDRPLSQLINRILKEYVKRAEAGLNWNL